MPLLQAPVLHQPVMQQPAMHPPTSMMQHAMQNFTFKFTASTAADENRHQDPFPRNSIDAANGSQEGTQEIQLQAIKQAGDRFENEVDENALSERSGLVSEPQLELPELVGTEDGKVDVLCSHDNHTEVAAEPQSEMPELLEAAAEPQFELPALPEVAAEPQCEMPELLEAAAEPQFELPALPDAENTCPGTLVEEAIERIEENDHGTNYRTMVAESLERVEDNDHNTMDAEALERVEDNDVSSHDDCVAATAEPQGAIQLMDIDQKCNSVVGANGDYRSGVARQAVAYLLKNSMPANKANVKLTNLQNGSIHTAENSTVASSTVTSRAASACPSQRSEKQEEEALQSGYATPAHPAFIEKPKDELQDDDEWASHHFEALENNSQSLEVAATSATATADDECRSYVSSIIHPPVASPSVSSTHPITCNEVEIKEACEGKTGVDASITGDVCPKGHQLRWHAWSCACCDKRGHGLRFGCAECHEANLCVACRKGPKQETKTNAAMISCEMQPLSRMNVDREAAAPETEPKKKDNSNRIKKPVDSASKSVLSMQPKGSSTAAQLLGGLVQQQGSKPRSSSRTQAGESKSLVGAAGSTQRRSGQRASASVLSVKHTSTSAAAGVLGPLLEQRAK